MNGNQRTTYLRFDRIGGGSFCRRFIWIMAFASALVLGPAELRAHICCTCDSGTLDASPTSVGLNEPVTITFTVRFCNCTSTQFGGPGCHDSQGADCGLQPVDIQVILEGFGVVHQTTHEFFKTADFLHTDTTVFTYTPTMAGVYTVITSGTCPTASAQFTVGCDGDCANPGGGPNPCPECTAQDLGTPQLTSNKSDNIIRTVCPTDCKAQKDDAHGETVTVTIAPGSGPTPDCYKLDVQVQGAVKIVNQPAASGAWPGSMQVELQGLIGLGSASVEVEFWKLDMESGGGGAEQPCWKRSGTTTITLEAKPDDDCECPNCPVGGGGSGRVLGTGGAIRAAPILGEITLGDVELQVRAGDGNILRIPTIVAEHPNGDIEVLLPGRADPVIFSPGTGFLEGWILGGPPGFRGADDGDGLRAIIQLSNINEARTYRFVTDPVGPAPYRLDRIFRFDFTMHSTYVYDAGGALIEIHVGAASSTTYFGLSYDVGEKLETITPVVDGTPDPVRAVTLVYDGDRVIGADGAVCETCGGEHRRYYFNTRGLLERVTDADGNDLELYTYDSEGRLTLLQRVNGDDVMVTVRQIEYTGSLREDSILTIHEPVSDTEERITVERYDDQGRLVQSDRYVSLFPISSTPSGDFLTTSYSYSLERDDITGVETTTNEVTDPAGVTNVTVLRAFADGAPLMLPIGEDDSGWMLPIHAGSNAFAFDGVQDGDAAITPLIEGAAGTARMEVGVTGIYFPRILIHEPADPAPDENMCVRMSVMAGTTGLPEEAFIARTVSDPPPAEPWSPFYHSGCSSSGDPGFEHEGWLLESGVLYTVTVEFLSLSASPNPPDGFGIDGLALTRFGSADPGQFPEAPYVRVDGQAQTIRTFMRGTDGSEGNLEIAVEAFDPLSATIVPVYRINPYAGKTRFEHNEQGLVVSQAGPEVALLDGGGSIGAVTTFEYDTNNRVTRSGRTNSAGGMVFTEFGYDSYGRRTLMAENADGGPGERAETFFGFNIYGEQTTLTDPCGYVTERFYGAGGQLIDEVAYAVGSSGALLKQTHYAYDTGGRVTRVRVAFDDGPFPMDGPADWSDATFTYDLFSRKLMETAPAPGGGTLGTEYTYDYQDQILEQRKPDGSVQRFVYDGLGRFLASSVEGTGVAPLTTTMTYNSAGQLERSQAPAEGITLFEYDVFGRMVARTDAARTQMSYDVAGKLMRTEVLNPSDSTALSDVITEYDVVGRRIRERTRLVAGIDGADDPLTIIAYDPAGRVRSRIEKANGNNDDSAYEPGDKLERHTYDMLGRAVTEVNGENERIDRVFNLCGRLLTQTLDPGGVNLALAYQYDALGRRIRTTDPELHYETIDFDSQDQTIRSTSYDNTDAILSRRIIELDDGGRVVRAARLADPNAASIDVAVDSVEAYEFDPATGLQTARSTYTDGTPKTLQLSYDGMGRRSLVRLPLDPGVNFAEVAYATTTGLTERVIRSDVLGPRTTHYQYDEHGHRTMEVQVGTNGVPDRVLSIDNDAMGRQIRLVGWDGKVKSRTYDLAGRITGVLDDESGLGQVQQLHYDRLGRLTRIVVDDSDGPPQETVYGYDAVDRPISTTASDGTITTYDYDAIGRVTTEHDPRGFAVDYRYEGRGLLTSRSVDDVGFEEFHVSEVFTFDGAGRPVLAQRDADNRTTLEYNALDHVVRQRQTIGGVEKEIMFGRSQTGQRTSLSVPGGPNLTYAYDELGRNTRIQRDGQPLVAYTHAGNLPLTRQILTGAGETIELAWQYDAHRLATGMANRTLGTRGVGQDLFVYDYGRNFAGHPTSETASGAVGGQQITYDYDTLRRLTTADYSGLRHGTEVFDYDVVGNRVTYHDRFTPSSDPGLEYTHDAANAYTMIGGSPLTHDGAGNLTKDEDGYQYTYDFANRVIQVHTSGGVEVASYVYDALGRRVLSTMDGVTTRHYFDEKSNVVAEFSEADALLRYFVDGTSFVDERAVVHDGASGQDFFYALKENYTVAGLIDQDGGIVESYTYDAYGAVQIDLRLLGDGDEDGDVDLWDFAGFQACFGESAAAGEQCGAYDANGDKLIDISDYDLLSPCFSGPPGGDDFAAPGRDCYRDRQASLYNPYFFTGRRLSLIDGGRLQLQWNQQRDYSPTRGRWLSRDPLELDAGPNLYEYARSSPLRFVDVQGLFAATAHTPWGDFGITVEMGCASIKWSDSKDKSWYFFAGKLVVTVAGQVEVEGKVCHKCCKKGTPRAGDEVFDVSVSGSLEGSATVTFRPWGFHSEVWVPFFGTQEVDGWLGITVAGTIKGKGSGTLTSDRCNNKLLTGQVCVTVGGDVTVSGGGQLSVKDADEDDPWLALTAAVRGQVSAEIENCYQCMGENCGWTGWKNPCIKGKVWVEFRVLKYGLSVDLIGGPIYGCS